MSLRNRIRQSLQQRRQRREIDALRKRAERGREEAGIQLRQLDKIRQRTEFTITGLELALENCRPEDRDQIEKHRAERINYLERINADAARLAQQAGESA